MVDGLAKFLLAEQVLLYNTTTCAVLGLRTSVEIGRRFYLVTTCLECGTKYQGKDSEVGYQLTCTYFLIRSPQTRQIEIMFEQKAGSFQNL